MTKRGNLEQWKELGSLSKEVYAKLGHICVLADRIMPAKNLRYADKAYMDLQRFRSDAEDVMFRQIGPGASIDIFYGGGYHSPPQPDKRS